MTGGAMTPAAAKLAEQRERHRRILRNAPSGWLTGGWSEYLAAGVPSVDDEPFVRDLIDRRLNEDKDLAIKIQEYVAANVVRNLYFRLTDGSANSLRHEQRNGVERAVDAIRGASNEVVGSI